MKPVNEENLSRASAPAEPRQVREMTDRIDPMYGDEFGENPRKHQTSFLNSKLGVDVSKLEAAGYHCHWVNDTENRVQARLADGYQFVTREEVSLAPKIGATDLSDKVSVISGTKDDGSPLTIFLMKIPKRWWMENQAETQKRPDQIDRQIRSGKVQKWEGDDSSADSFYVKEADYGRKRPR